MDASTDNPTYDDIADWYDACVNEASLAADPIFRETRALVGDVAGLRICDLACGQGRITRALAADGADMLGIDHSRHLIEIARRHGGDQPGRIAYLCASACDLDSVPNEHFDGVLCHMALMDIDDFELALQSAARILKPDGWFVFSILHPCFNTARSGEIETAGGWTRTVSGYFIEGYWRSATRSGPPGRVGAYHRTLATYINALHNAGLILDRFVEPRFTGTTAERRPIWAEVPAVLVGRCRKLVRAAEAETQSATQQAPTRFDS